MPEPSPQNQLVISTVVASRPGVMQQSLRASLAAYSWLSVVASAGDGLTALNQTVQHRPGLLVIDSNLLDEEVEALLAGVKAKVPATRCLVCLRSSRRAKLLLAAGAAGVILRDSSAQQWQAILRRLLAE